MLVPYLKMHGTGNLILVVDQRVQNLPPPDREMIRVLGDKKSGPGFDQMMWISAAHDAACVASYRAFNADGSEVEQCGNGVRCVAKYLAGKGAIGSRFELCSPAGRIAARVDTDGQVTVSMGAPQFEPARIPFIADAAADTYPLDIGGNNVAISAVSMGNPHAVLQVADVNRAPIAEVGPTIEHHERFPQRSNVGFMHIRDRRTIDLRVHERGVGETAACGTGACAAVVCAQRRGLLDEAVRVHLPGGQVMVNWRGGETPVWLTGDAEMINHGTMHLHK